MFSHMCMQARYNVMEALVYLGPFTTAFLAAGAFAFEWDQGLATTVGALLRAWSSLGVANNHLQVV